MRFPIAASAEFPNDNPELHEGASWVCLDTCAPAMAIIEPRSTPRAIAPDGAFEPPPAPPPEPLALDLAAEAVIHPSPIEDDGEDYEDDCDEDEDEGADDIEVVDELEGFDVGPTEASEPFSIFVRKLAEVALAAGGSDAAALVPAALADEATARAWRAIINGESEDFAACGAKPLDEWASELVARLVSAPNRAAQLRRELRARGIAAFGLVLDAA